MASNAPSFDDMTEVTVADDSDDDDVPVVKLDPAEEIAAQVRHIEHNVGRYDNTMLHLTRDSGEFCKMWSNRTINGKLQAADVGPGDWVGVRKSEEPYTYENDDGEEREAFDFEVAVWDGDD